MSGSPSSATSVDLSRLPPPAILDLLGYDAIYAALIADFQARLPGFDALVESDPVIKLLQAFAYRELLLRQLFDDRARQVMVAYATGPNLDQLGALVGVTRLVLIEADADAGTLALLESDDALRQRIVLAPESFSVAGPELAYVFHAKSASGDVGDASAISPEPGEVVVTVLAAAGDGNADADLLALVEAAIGADDVRPLTDQVSVQSAEIIEWALTAQLRTFAGPDTAIVLAAARTRLDAYLADNRRLGRAITRSGLDAALTVAGVERVILASPPATIECDLTQAAHCTAITITHGGYAG